MLVFGHLLVGVVAGLIARRVHPALRTPLWPWALGALLPDLIDKPLAFYGHGWETTTRAIGHSLLFVALLVAAGTGRPRLRAVGLAALTHLLADQPWTYPETFWWPLMGPQFHQGSPIRVEFFVERLLQPAMLATEILAALLLAALLIILHPPRRLPETPGERIRSLRARLLGIPDADGPREPDPDDADDRS